MAGHRRGIDIFEDDAEYEEDDEILIKTPHASSRRSTKNQPYHYVAESYEDISEDIDDAISSDDESDGHHTPNSAKDESKCEKRQEHEDDEYEERYCVLKSKSNGNNDDSDLSIADDDDSNNSSDTEAEEPWIPAPEDEDDVVNPNCCIFCHQNEENDPSEEFEIYLSCSICGDNAHRQCARNANALQTEDEGELWYCSDCVSNNLVPEKSIQQMNSPSKRRKASRDKITDNLVLSHREITKKKLTSISNQSIAFEDSRDSTRLLRRRRNSRTGADTQDANNPRTRPRNKNESLGYVKSPVFDEDYWKSDEMEIDAPGSPLKSPLINGLKKTCDENLKTRASRVLVPNSSLVTQKYARIIEKTTTTLKIAIKVDAAEVANRLSHPHKSKKRKHTPVGTISSFSSSNFVSSTLPQSFYSLHDKDVDESKSKPYGGILTEEQADTTLTMPSSNDRQKFDEARQKAEEDWKARVSVASQAVSVAGVKKSRKFSELTSEIEYIEFGKYQIDIWYDAPYPEEYSRNKALFICEFCLKYMESDIVAWRHTTKCPWKTPPGDEIYRDGQVAVFEVDGRKNTLYCQNLCLLAKLFLGSKTLYYDVEPFLFYVMTEYDQYGCHFVGYFSKEKRPSSLNNVSCILVLPIHQQKGYGHLLIDFSYLLTRVEKKTGSPEKPLSDMGLVSYRSYWRLVLCTYLKDFKSGDKVPSIREISDNMGLTPDDVISALDALGALIRDPITGTYAMKLKPDYYREIVERHESRKYVKLNPKALFWTPYVMGRGIVPSFDYISLNKIASEDEQESKDLLAISPTESKKRDYESISFCNEESETVTKSLGKLRTGESLVSGEVGDLETVRATLKNSNKTQSYYEAAASIPPTRFEIFPSLRGAQSKATPRSLYCRPNTSRKKSYCTSRPTIRNSSELSPHSPTITGICRGNSGRVGSRNIERDAKHCLHEEYAKDSVSCRDENSLKISLKSRRSKLGADIQFGSKDKIKSIEDNGKKELQGEDEDARIYGNTPIAH